MHTSNFLIILSSHSAGGKNTIASLLKLNRLITHTSRKPRSKEVEGVDYFFVSEKTFLSLDKKNYFIEKEKIFGNYYGLHKNQLEKLNKENCLALLDVKGGLSLKKKLNNVTCIFIKPEKKKLEKRLLLRSHEKEDIQKRLGRISLEEAYMHKYDYIIEEKSVDKIVNKINKIISDYCL